MLSRRAALQGGSAAMAIAAPLAVIPLRTKAEDGEVFGIVEEWRCELRLERAAEDHWRDAISSHMPADFQWSTALQSFETIKECSEISRRPEIEALSAEADRRKEARQGLENRLVATPATTLDGINAKLQASFRRKGYRLNGDIARSAADDLERLVGEG